VTEAGVDGISGDIDNPLRKNRVSWLNSSDPAQHWIFHRLLDLIMDVNRSYRYDLMFLESLQFTIYDQQGDHYGYHTDFNPEGLGGNIRKISFSLQLSNESDYQGGDLEMMICDTGKFNAVKDQGSVTFFPSYTMHRVTPITHGVRDSLVGWVMGPPFK
jgi:PKHD-type hydroxylase